MPEENKIVPITERVIIPEFYFPNTTNILTQDEKRANAKRLEGISVRFKITKYRNAVMNKAQISIANLERADIEYLTTFTSWALAIAKRKRIRIFAGYKSQSVGLLFDGDITYATPTMPPDIWLNCEALSGFYDNQNVMSLSMEGQITLKEICQKVADELGLRLSYQTTINKKVDGFVYCGGARNVLYKLNTLADITVYEDMGTLVVADLYKLVEGSRVKVINMDTGLIGIPRPDPLGVKLTVLLDPTVKLGDTIKLESTRIPSASGYYYIYTLTHEGTSRENAFYTHLECRRHQNE